MKNKFEKLDSNFEKCVKEGNLKISSIEELMINEIEDFKVELNNHIEELIIKDIDEQELISKKNKNGRKKDII